MSLSPLPKKPITWRVVLLFISMALCLSYWIVGAYVMVGPPQKTTPLDGDMYLLAELGYFLVAILFLIASTIYLTHDSKWWEEQTRIAQESHVRRLHECPDCGHVCTCDYAEGHCWHECLPHRSSKTRKGKTT